MAACDAYSCHESRYTETRGFIICMMVRKETHESGPRSWLYLISFTIDDLPQYLISSPRLSGFPSPIPPEIPLTTKSTPHYRQALTAITDSPRSLPKQPEVAAAVYRLQACSEVRIGEILISQHIDLCLCLSVIQFADHCNPSSVLRVPHPSGSYFPSTSLAYRRA